MAATMNMKARGFVLRRLFLAEPDAGYATASLSALDLASEHCAASGCRGSACRRHVRATLVGASKLIVDGDVFGELSPRGVLFLRLSPKGVLLPSTWTTVPRWFDEDSPAVVWARGEAVV